MYADVEIGVLRVIRKYLVQFQKQEEYILYQQGEDTPIQGATKPEKEKKPKNKDKKEKKEKKEKKQKQ